MNFRLVPGRIKEDVLHGTAGKIINAISNGLDIANLNIAGEILWKNFTIRIQYPLMGNGCAFWIKRENIVGKFFEIDLYDYISTNLIILEIGIMVVVTALIHIYNSPRG